MANPDIAEVQTALTAMETQMTIHDNFAFLLDQKQEAVESMHTLVDPIIKKVWDEAETFFNEETPESKRANARLWGVVYVTEGPPATLTGLVKDPLGAAVPNALLTMRRIIRHRHHQQRRALRYANYRIRRGNHKGTSISSSLR
jgi:hypothetical protein